MTSETVITKRLIKDHMLSNHLKTHPIDIGKAMIKAFKGAHSKYQNHLEEKRKKRVLSELEKKAIHISSDIESLKVKVRQMEKAVSMMEEELLDCMKLAEKKSDLSFVIKGNSLKRIINIILLP